ncbi:MmpS family transport accessory protein [Flavobacterium sp.]|uniref:MmpS family transport accessory protein n=1 Tax=Flavobacterium sp. TaxID=239 RepID=UPI002FD94CC4
MRTTKNLLKGLFLFFLLSIIITGCSSDDNSSNSRKVTFKVVGSNGANITTIVYALNSETFPVLNVNSSNWTSEEITLPADVNILSLSGNAIGSSASSSIRLEILVNGQVKKQQSASGTVMSTFTQYTIN